MKMKKTLVKFLILPTLLIAWAYNSSNAAYTYTDPSNYIVTANDTLSSLYWNQMANSIGYIYEQLQTVLANYTTTCDNTTVGQFNQAGQVCTYIKWYQLSTPNPQLLSVKIDTTSQYYVSRNTSDQWLCDMLYWQYPTQSWYPNMKFIEWSRSHVRQSVSWYQSYDYYLQWDLTSEKFEIMRWWADDYNRVNSISCGTEDQYKFQ